MVLYRTSLKALYSTLNMVIEGYRRSSTKATTQLRISAEMQQDVMVPHDALEDSHTVAHGATKS